MAQEKTEEWAAANPGANSAEQMGAGSAGALRAPAAVYGANRQELCPCPSLLRHGLMLSVLPGSGHTYCLTHCLPVTRNVMEIHVLQTSAFRRTFQSLKIFLPGRKAAGIARTALG